MLAQPKNSPSNHGLSAVISLTYHFTQSCSCKYINVHRVLTTVDVFVTKSKMEFWSLRAKINIP